jgi:hypothetical protein
MFVKLKCDAVVVVSKMKCDVGMAHLKSEDIKGRREEIVKILEL